MDFKVAWLPIASPCRQLNGAPAHPRAVAIGVDGEPSPPQQRHHAPPWAAGSGDTHITLGLLKKKLYNQFLDRTMTSGLLVFYAASPDNSRMSIRGAMPCNHTSNLQHTFGIATSETLLEVHTSKRRIAHASMQRLTPKIACSLRGGVVWLGVVVCVCVPVCRPVPW